jgi:Toprim domain
MELIETAPRDKTARSAADILRENGITTAATVIGRYYTTCPQCSPLRKKAGQKCLGVTIGHDGVKFGCNHCQWSGGGRYELPRTRSDRPKASAPAIEKDRKRHAAETATSRKKARWLWSHREPITGSIAERYLRECRGYTGALPGTLGFLLARDEHPPAMIGAFGAAIEHLPGELMIYDTAVRGVHLTKLLPDGSGKAGTDADKLTIGMQNNSPIWLAPVNDLGGLAITEGIEDALSVHAATGMGAWAAGTAGRLPAMADHIPNYVESVTVMVDADPVGETNANELAKRLDAKGLEVLLVRPEWRG